MALQNCIVFRVNQSLYAVDVQQADEVEKNAVIRTIPGMPDSMLGLVDVRNQVVPVISVRKHFNLPPLAADSEYELILSHNQEYQVAYQVDRVYAIKILDFQEINAAPEIIKSTTGCVQRVTELDGEVVVMLDMIKLLTEQENEDLIKFIEDVIKE